MPSGSPARCLFDEALFANELPPVVRGDKAEAIDAVADRNLIGGLGLAFGPNEILGGKSLIGKTVLEPTVGKGEIWILPL